MFVWNQQHILNQDKHEHEYWVLSIEYWALSIEYLYSLLFRYIWHLLTISGDLPCWYYIEYWHECREEEGKGDKESICQNGFDLMLWSQLRSKPWMRMARSRTGDSQRRNCNSRGESSFSPHCSPQRVSENQDAHFFLHEFQLFVKPEVVRQVMVRAVLIFARMSDAPRCCFPVFHLFDIRTENLMHYKLSAPRNKKIKIFRILSVWLIFSPLNLSLQPNEAEIVKCWLGVAWWSVDAIPP